METDQRLHILVVDDNPAWRRTMLLCLKRFPGVASIDAVPDGRTALKFCETTKPDLVIMDINMPKMNGFEAAHALLGRYPDLWIFAVSADVQPDFQQRALVAGLKAVIRKDMVFDYLFPSTPDSSEAGLLGSRIRLPVTRGKDSLKVSDQL